MQASAPLVAELEPKVGAKSIDDDPYDLRVRFVDSHRRYHAQALAELRAGHKQSCWAWYILPTAPWVVNGRERGSPMNQEYALRDLPPDAHRGDKAARAFLRFPAAGGCDEGEVSLRNNYVEILSVIAEQLEAGVTPRALLGCDCTRLRASVELFERASADGFDSECHDLCQRILDKTM